MNFWTGLIWIYGMHSLLIGFFLLFKKQYNDARINRVLFLSILVLPLLVWIPLPEGSLIKNAVFRVDLPELIFQETASSEGEFSFALLYWIPTVLLAGRLVYSLIKLLAQTIRLKTKKEYGLRVFEIEGLRGAKSFFNLLFIPADLEEKSKSYIQAHEKVHARQFHSIDRLLMHLIRCLFWANPLLYVLEREMVLNHEYLADQGVLEQDRDKVQYMELMLAEALQTSPELLSHSFSLHHQVKNRINYMQQSHTRSNMYWAWIPALVLIIGFAACNEEVGKDPQTHTPDEIEVPNDETLNMGQVDVQPEMEGGMEAMMNFLKNEVKYPESMKEEGAEAKVMVQFTVQADGSLSDIQAMEGDADDAFKEEAVRAVSTMPNWNPGSKDGKPVAVTMVLPIRFTMK